jgi:cytochrome c oxidase assembly factor CtaG
MLYASGLVAMGPARRRAIAPPARILCWAGAVAITVVALFSPLDALADDSFAWHMAQHLMLMLGSSPLFASANTHLVALMAFPLPLRRRIGGTINRAPGVKTGSSSRLAPLVAALCFVAGLWLWHAPRLYDLALSDPGIHTLEHLTFVITSAVFWRMVVTSGNRRLDRLSGIVLVTLVGLQGNLLAALITLAPHPLYQGYIGNTIEDQQVAGLLMWVPAGLVYLAATVHALWRILSFGHTPRFADAAVPRSILQRPVRSQTLSRRVGSESKVPMSDHL